MKRSAPTRQIHKGRVNRAKLLATTEVDIQRYIKEDGIPEQDWSQARKVHNPPLRDVPSIRKKLGLSQAEFADRFGLSLRTVQQWEQRRVVPDRPARILLEVIARDPKAVDKALRR